MSLKVLLEEKIKEASKILNNVSFGSSFNSLSKTEAKRLTAYRYTRAYPAEIFTELHEVTRHR